MKDEIILYRHNQLAEHIEVRIDEEKETIYLAYTIANSGFVRNATPCYYQAFREYL